ncbi:hypothetical protein Tco_0536881 [Tanacetum coccineum]
MDPNSSLGKICLGDNVIKISSVKVEGSGDWSSLEYQDTAVSKGKKVMNALNKMEINEVNERYIAPCFMNGLEAYDGEINLEYDENLISNEFVVKLCLDYEVKKGQKLVKKSSLLEGKVNENTLAGSDINTMSYRIYETLGREEMKKVDRGIMMINHTQAEAMGYLLMFFVKWGFDVLRTTESDNDDEEEYVIKRNKFGALIYGPKPAPYLNCTNPTDRSSAIQTVINPF